MKFPFIKYSKIYFLFSGIMVATSLAAIVFFGFNWGVDFVGGTILRVVYIGERPTTKELSQELYSSLGLENLSIRFSGEKGVVIRMIEISSAEKNELLSFFHESPDVDNEAISLELVSPLIGRESKAKAGRAILLSIIAIILYVAFIFRKVSKAVKSWQYGIATVIALVHDVLIPLGLIAVLGSFLGVEFSIPILTALLIIFGYSVNDTVVVFDRIRENLIHGSGVTFEEVVDESLNQTLVRSINTSLTTLFVLFSIFFFGGAILTYFSLVLIIGVIAGTYSSIFLASPLLTWWLSLQQAKR